MARIAILLYDGVDVIDSGGPYEVFLTASRLQVRHGDDPSFDVILVSPGGADVTAFGGMRLTALTPADGLGEVDVVVIPGTVDVDAVLADDAIRAAVRSLIDAASVTTSVCTGAFLLADAGLLTYRPATTHWEDLDLLAARDDVSEVVHGRRWADAGAVVTSAGLASGIHMALHMVERIAGRALAQATARQLDVDWDPEGNR